MATRVIAKDTSEQYNYAKNVPVIDVVNGEFIQNLDDWIVGDGRYGLYGWVWDSENEGQAKPDFSQSPISGSWYFFNTSISNLTVGDILEFEFEITEAFDGSGVKCTPHHDGNVYNDPLGYVKDKGVYKVRFAPRSVTQTTEFVKFWAAADNTTGAIKNVVARYIPHTATHAVLEGWSDEELTGKEKSITAIKNFYKPDEVLADRYWGSNNYDGRTWRCRRTNIMFADDSFTWMGEYMIEVVGSISFFAGSSANNVELYLQGGALKLRWSGVVESVGRISGGQNGRCRVVLRYNNVISEVKIFIKGIDNSLLEMELSPSVISIAPHLGTDLTVGRSGTGVAAQYTGVKRLIAYSDVKTDEECRMFTFKGEYPETGKILDWVFGLSGEQSSLDSYTVVDQSGNGNDGTTVYPHSTTGNDITIWDINGLPFRTYSLKLNGSTSKLIVPNFNPSGEEGYTFITIVKMSSPPNEDSTNSHRLYGIRESDMSGTHFFFSLYQPTEAGDVSLWGSNHDSGNSSYAAVNDIGDGFVMISHYIKTSGGDVTRSIGRGGSDSNLFDNTESGSFDLDCSNYSDPVLTIGATDMNEAFADVSLFFLGVCKGRVRGEHLAAIYNNSKPKMPNPNWGYKWELLLDLNAPVDPSGTPRIKDLSSQLNSDGIEKNVFMEGFTIDELNSEHSEYVFQPIEDFRT